jgi:DNA-binding NtrC family response regulator
MGHGDLETAVNTMRLGAFDYISNQTWTGLFNRPAMRRTAKAFVENTISKEGFQDYEMVGESEPQTYIFKHSWKVAPTDVR